MFKAYTQSVKKYDDKFCILRLSKVHVLGNVITDTYLHIFSKNSYFSKLIARIILLGTLKTNTSFSYFIFAHPSRPELKVIYRHDTNIT